MRVASSNGFAKLSEKRVRAADAKEVGVGNPAEETYRHPNKFLFSLFATIELDASLSTSLNGPLF
jgi:hypothetical protein